MTKSKLFNVSGSRSENNKQKVQDNCEIKPQFLPPPPTLIRGIRPQQPQHAPRVLSPPSLNSDMCSNEGNTTASVLFGVITALMSRILSSDWSSVITWPYYWPLIGQFCQIVGTFDRGGEYVLLISWGSRHLFQGWIASVCHIPNIPAAYARPRHSIQYIPQNLNIHPINKLPIQHEPENENFTFLQHCVTQ